MWFWMWTLLIVGTLAGATVLARALWRKVRAVGHAMGELGNAISGVESRTVSQPRLWSHPRPATALGDVEAALEYRDQREVARFTQRGLRLARNRVRWQQWNRFNE